MNNLSDLITDFNLSLLFKIPFLVMVFVYGIITFIIFNRVRALNRIVYVQPAHASALMLTFAFLYFLITVALFLFALAIL